MRGEDLDAPAVRPALVLQVADGVGRFAAEAEADRHVPAPRASRITLETEGAGNGKISRKAGVHPNGRGESSGIGERAARLVSRAPRCAGLAPGAGRGDDRTDSALRRANDRPHRRGGGRSDVQDARGAADDPGGGGPEPALVVTGPEHERDED